MKIKNVLILAFTLQIALFTSGNLHAKDKEALNSEIITAVAYQNANDVKKLIRQGADVNASVQGTTPLNTAAATGNAEIVEILLNAGAKTEQKDSSGWTPLATAAGKGFVNIMELLLKYKADINARDNSGATPLILAATTGQIKSVKYLIEKGADINVKNKYGYSAYNFAVNNGHKEIADFLKSKGAM